MESNRNEAGDACPSSLKEDTFPGRSRPTCMSRSSGHTSHRRCHASIAAPRDPADVS